MDDINMDVDDGASEAQSIASDRLGDDIDNKAILELFDVIDEEEHLSRAVDAAEELVLEEHVLEEQLNWAFDAALIQNVRNISYDLSVALRD
jgi:hypothetical protein